MPILFAEAGVEVIGISVDSKHTLRAELTKISNMSTAVAIAVAAGSALLGESYG